MRCTRCGGAGHLPIATYLAHTSLRDGAQIKQTLIGTVPCPECQGRAIAHCCEGDRACPDADISLYEGKPCLLR